MLIKKIGFSFLLLLFHCFLQEHAHAQCTTPINTFPYAQGFESDEGGWVRDSPSYWEWGQITSKPIINTAGGGLKCWIVGGLSGGQYTSGSSAVVSPCFDISSLTNPEVSFKIFWETEQKYDGVTFQYSLDGGLVWNTLGSINSNSNCQGANWFNFDPLFTLPVPAWSGNIQPTSGSCLGGGGSGSWLTAKHTLSSIAGATSVMFRFVFSAGLTCNAFAGFAFDDFGLGDAVPNNADYTYTCNSNSSVAFTSNISGCKTNVAWTFGDTGSPDNSSNLENPTHIFSSPGNYTVTLTVTFASGPVLSVAKTISVIGTSAVVTALKCHNAVNAAISIQVNPPGTYNYTWDTNPVQSTPTISGLSAGTYTVVITGTNVCSTSMPVTITNPEAINNLLMATNARCGNSNGFITVITSGGVPPYSYLWSNSEITSTITGLAPGFYSVSVKDANGCSSPTNATITNVDIVPSVSLGTDRPLCPGETISLSPGSYTSYLWQDNSIASTYLVTTPGTYSVAIKDADGCSGSASVNITDDCTDVFFPSAFTPNGDGRNDGFGPLPSTVVSSIKNYKLTIYGRWGEVIFTTKDPNVKWDGTYNGKPLPTQVVTWIAVFTQNNKLPETRSGTLSIIR